MLPSNNYNGTGLTTLSTDRWPVTIVFYGVAVTGEASQQTCTSNIYDGGWQRPEEPFRLLPSHRVLTEAAMRDVPSRAVRRMRSKVQRSLALERRTWVAAPRRVTR